MTTAVPGSTWTYFLGLLSRHGRVGRYEKIDENLVKIYRNFGDEIEVLLTNEYVFSVANAHEFWNRRPSIRIFCNGGPWNKVSREAAELVRGQNSAVLRLRDLSGALHRERFWTYEPKVD